MVKWTGYPDTENSWVDESDITSDLIKSFDLLVKRRGSNCSQALSSATQTLGPQTTSSPSVNRESTIENNRSCDLYFEEDFHNLGANVQLESTTNDFQLFSAGM